MKMTIIKQLKNDLIRHEGMRLKPYKCTAGKLTIGVGRNLEDNGISEIEAMKLLNEDVYEIYTDARIGALIDGLDDERTLVILNMAFQMGIGGVLQFKNMIAAIKAGDYNRAADEMLNSAWASQTPSRAKELAERMRNGGSLKLSGGIDD